MGALAATDVTVAIQNRAKIERLGRMTRLTISLGDGSKTVPSGGVPLPAKSAFGMARDNIFSMDLPRVTAGGLLIDYDRTNHKLRFWQAAGFTPAGQVAAHTHDLKLIGGITATEPLAVQGGDTLGKNAATDRTIAGADAATKGGVVGLAAGSPAFTGTTVAAAALVEFTGALPAMVLGALVIGD